MNEDLEDLCPIFDMPRMWCAHCRNKDLPQPAPLAWFPARFDGRCAVCNGPIKVGADIASTEDGYICRRPHD